MCNTSYSAALQLIDYTFHRLSDSHAIVTNNAGKDTISDKDYITILQSMSYNVDIALQEVEAILSSRNASFTLASKIEIPGELIIWAATITCDNASISTTGIADNPTSAILFATSNTWRQLHRQ